MAGRFADLGVTAEELRRSWGTTPNEPCWPERGREWADLFVRITDPGSGYAPPAVTAAVVRCVFGNPFRPVELAPGWRTETVIALAAGIYAEKAFDRMPVLADALDDAGCDDPEVVAHLRGPGPHARGCWVVDLVLGNS